MPTTTLGQRILLLVAATVVATSGVIGFIIGSNSGASTTTIRVFDLLTLPSSPASLALYGVAVSTAAMAVLFGAVALASRFEEPV
ncbi:MAG: DUF7520 family protein [Halobacteriota archaeon]